MPATSWNLSPPPGFQGLDPNKPVTIYQRHLPHWRQEGATYFVTSRLADSLPQSKLQELEIVRKEWRARQDTSTRVGRLANPSHNHIGRSANPSYAIANPEDVDEELARQTMQCVEDWLDQGMGSCWLRRADLNQHVISALAHFDDDRYELDAYVIMPNHMHLIIRPLHPQRDPLERILQSRKRQIARDINRVLGRRDRLWQEESFDRIIRDEEHLYRCIQYIGSNPRRAGLSLEVCPRWIRPLWIEAGWRFEDQ